MPASTLSKRKWQLLQKLTKAECDEHMHAIRVMNVKDASGWPELEKLREHIEPLMKHYFLEDGMSALKFTNLVNRMAGIRFSVNAYTKAADKWGIPFPKARMHAKPRPVSLAVVNC